MSSKLEPVIWSCDTGHIGIHGWVDVRTDLRTVTDVIAKTKISRIDELPYFLNYGAPRARLWGAELRCKIGNILRDLLMRVSERSCFPLRSPHNFTSLFARTERCKRSFFPSTTKFWNDIDLEVRLCDTIRYFKRMLIDYYKISDYFIPFHYSLERYCSIIHTRLRLDACALYYYLFEIRATFSPICSCGFFS